MFIRIQKVYVWGAWFNVGIAKVVVEFFKVIIWGTALSFKVMFGFFAFGDCE